MVNTPHSVPHTTHVITFNLCKTRFPIFVTVLRETVVGGSGRRAAGRRRAGGGGGGATPTPTSAAHIDEFIEKL